MSFCEKFDLNVENDKRESLRTFSHISKDIAEYIEQDKEMLTASFANAEERQHAIIGATEKWHRIRELIEPPFRSLEDEIFALRQAFLSYPEEGGELMGYVERIEKELAQSTLLHRMYSFFLYSCQYRRYLTAFYEYRIGEQRLAFKVERFYYFSEIEFTEDFKEYKHVKLKELDGMLKRFRRKHQAEVCLVGMNRIHRLPLKGHVEYQNREKRRLTLSGNAPPVKKQHKNTGDWTHLFQG